MNNIQQFSSKTCYYSETENPHNVLRGDKLLRFFKNKNDLVWHSWLIKYYARNFVRRIINA